MFKKFVSLVLCIMISITSFPVQVLAQDVAQKVGFNDDMENVSKINASSAGTVMLTQDKVSGKYAVKVSMADEVNQNFATYKLTDCDSFDSSEFSQVKMWVKPDKGAKWIEFKVKNINGVESLIKNDKNGDGKFEVGTDLVSGKWNSVVLELNKSSKVLTNISQLLVNTNELSNWLYDEIKSVYAPILALDMSKYVDSQTELVDGKIQFKQNSAGAYNTTPTVLSYSNQPKFYRDTVANNDNGSQVTAGTPRYIEGKHGKGILIEESTTNIISNSSFENYTSTSGVADNWLKWNPTGFAVSYSVDSSFARVSGGRSQKISLTSSNGPSHAIVQQKFNVTPGQTYTLSMYVAGTVYGANAKAKLLTIFYDAAGNALTNSQKYFTPNPTTFQRMELTPTVPTNAVTASIECGIDVKSAGETGTVYIDDVQVEQKAYSTSYIAGGSTRDKEGLTFPTSGVLNPKEGTIEFWVNFQSLNDKYQAMFSSGAGGPGPRLLIMRDWGIKGIRVWDGDGNSEVVLQSNTLPESGQYYHVAFTWSPSGRRLYINGKLESSNTRGNQIGFQSLAYIGKWGLNYSAPTELNGMLDDFRISDTAKTNQEISADYNANNPLTVESSTTYKLDFDNNLEANGVSQGISLPNGKISSVNIDSTYFDSKLNQEISSLPNERLYLPGINPTQFDLSGDGSRVYYKTDTGLNMLNLSNAAITTIAPVTFSPTEIKVNFDGSKVALKDANKNLYLYNDTTKTLKTVDNEVTFVAIANDGSLGYSRNTTNGPYIGYVGSTGQSGGNLYPTVFTIKGLDISKEGKDIFYSLSNSTSGSNSIYGERYVEGKKIHIVATNTGGSVNGLKANENGSMFFYKVGSNWYAYEVSSKSVKMLNIEDGLTVCDVSDDNKLLYNDDLGYALYNCSTDQDVDTGIRDEYYSSSSSNCAISNKGNKVAYTSKTGLKIRYLDGSPRPERYLLSFDGKNSWLTYKKGTWSVVSTETVPTESVLDQYGMTISEVNGLTEEDFASLYEVGKEIFEFDVAIKFASADAYVTPSLKGITVTLSPLSAASNGNQIIKPLYTRKTSVEYDAKEWRQINRIYPIEIQPREAETYYFVYSNGTYYNFTNNQLTQLTDQSLLSNVESNWIDITLQGLSVDQLRNLPTNALNSLLCKKFQVVYGMKVLDVTTEPYNSMITVDYVENLFESTNLVLQITLNNGQVKEYDLGKEKIEDFMVWLNERQHNKGPIFYRLETTPDDPGIVKVNGFVNYYDIQYVDVIEK